MLFFFFAIIDPTPNPHLAFSLDRKFQATLQIDCLFISPPHKNCLYMETIFLIKPDEILNKDI
jgi:hypothetical protein